MDPLEELLDRTTIEFPTSIVFEEIENKLFKYLIKELRVNQRWSFSGQGAHSSINGSRDRYIDKITLQLSKMNSPFSFGVFEFERDNEDYVHGRNSFKSMRLATYACDSLEEVMSLPSGEGQLKLVDEVKEKVKEYFSQRQKRSK